MLAGGGVRGLAVADGRRDRLGAVVPAGLPERAHPGRGGAGAVGERGGPGRCASGGWPGNGWPARPGSTGMTVRCWSASRARHRAAAGGGRAPLSGAAAEEFHGPPGRHAVVRSTRYSACSPEVWRSAITTGSVVRRWFRRRASLSAEGQRAADGCEATAIPAWSGSAREVGLDLLCDHSKVSSGSTRCAALGSAQHTSLGTADLTRAFRGASGTNGRTNTSTAREECARVVSARVARQVGLQTAASAWSGSFPAPFDPKSDPKSRHCRLSKSAPRPERTRAQARPLLVEHHLGFESHLERLQGRPVRGEGRPRDPSFPLFKMW